MSWSRGRRAGHGELALDEFTNELFDGSVLFFGGVLHGDETFLIDFYLEMAPLDIGFEAGRFEKFLVVR